MAPSVAAADTAPGHSEGLDKNAKVTSKVASVSLAQSSPTDNVAHR